MTDGGSGLTIAEARVPEDMDRVRVLFREYHELVDEPACFAGFEDELRTLPGRYAAPRGRLLLAWDGDEIAGGVAMGPLDGGACEMKRLYVRRAWRGRRLGRRLAEAVVEAARTAGHRVVALDTLPRMAEARTLYATLGFTESEPWQGPPENGLIYMRLELPRP